MLESEEETYIRCLQISRNKGQVLADFDFLKLYFKERFKVVNHLNMANLRIVKAGKEIGGIRNYDGPIPRVNEYIVFNDIDYNVIEVTTSFIKIDDMAGLSVRVTLTVQ